MKKYTIHQGARRCAPTNNKLWLSYLNHIFANQNLCRDDPRLSSPVFGGKTLKNKNRYKICCSGRYKTKFDI